MFSANFLSTVTVGGSENISHPTSTVEPNLTETITKHLSLVVCICDRILFHSLPRFIFYLEVKYCLFGF